MKLLVVVALLCHVQLGSLFLLGAQDPQQATGLGAELLASTESAGCNDTLAELVFVLDSSGSVGIINFDLMKDFVKTFIKQLDIGSNLARVGLITFNRFPTLRIRLTDYTDANDLLNAVDAHVPYYSGITETHLALDLLKREGYFMSRPDVPKVAIVITDGKSFQPTMTLASAAAVRALGVNVFAIGVGTEANMNELHGIATDANHVFTVTDFAALSEIGDSLARQACNSSLLLPNETITTPEPATQVPVTIAPINESLVNACNESIADVMFVLDSSGSLGQGNFALVKQFVKNIISVLDVGANLTRVGVMTYNNFPTLRLRLDSTFDKQTILNQIDQIPYYPGNTETDLALDLLTLEGFKGSRPGSPHVAIVITDGKSTEPSKTMASAQRAKDDGAVIFSIGVGDSINPDELNFISSDPDRNFVFYVYNFTALASLEAIIAQSTCDVPELLQETVEPSLPPTTVTATTTTTEAMTTTTAEITTTEKATTEEATTEPTTTVSSCLAKVADVVFVIDSSGSVGAANFDLVKDFVKLTVDFFDIGFSYTRVGMITYNEQASLQFGLLTHTTAGTIHTAVDNIRYTQGGTNTAAALEMLRTQGFSQDRPTTPNIAIVVTDGLSKDPLATRQQAFLAKQAGITLLAIGIKGADQTELNNIASMVPGGSSYAYTVGDFKALDTLESVIAFAACQVGVQTGPPITATQNSPQTTYFNGCVNKISDCDKYGHDACSDYKPWALDHCALFCGLCPGPKTTPTPCADTLPNCDQYGTYICSDLSFSTWTEKNCRQYCGLCGNRTITTPAPTSAPAPTTTDGPCQDLLGNCYQYGGKSMCSRETYKAWASKNCAAYCGFCVVKTMIEPVILKNNFTCPTWNLPVACTMATIQDGCCPIPLCPPGYVLTADLYDLH